MLQVTCIFLVVILSCSAKAEDPKCSILGSPVQITETPWLVSVIKRDEYACSGVIYTRKFIITAADCVEYAKLSDLQVRAGSSIAKSGGTVATVCELINHGNGKSRKYSPNLAVLGLCQDLPATKDTIETIKVIGTEPVDGDNVTVTGWGSSKYWGEFKKTCWAKSAVILRQAHVHIYNVTSCAADRRGWYKTNAVTELNICTEKPDKLCSYDMGSPLVSGGNLVGILSKADCSKKPDVFISLVNYINWLKAITKK